MRKDTKRALLIVPGAAQEKSDPPCLNLENQKRLTCSRMTGVFLFSGSGMKGGEDYDGN